MMGISKGDLKRIKNIVKALPGIIFSVKYVTVHGTFVEPGFRYPREITANYLIFLMASRNNYIPSTHDIVAQQRRLDYIKQILDSDWVRRKMIFISAYDIDTPDDRANFEASFGEILWPEK